ncbi:hypothetical protein P7C70_g3638, partial [Phenoliferia sp. Uapishka_3]
MLTVWKRWGAKGESSDAFDHYANTIARNLDSILSQTNSLNAALTALTTLIDLTWSTPPPDLILALSLLRCASSEALHSCFVPSYSTKELAKDMSALLSLRGDARVVAGKHLVGDVAGVDGVTEEKSETTGRKSSQEILDFIATILDALAANVPNPNFRPRLYRYGSGTLKSTIGGEEGWNAVMNSAQVLNRDLGAAVNLLATGPIPSLRIEPVLLWPSHKYMCKSNQPLLFTPRALTENELALWINQKGGWGVKDPHLWSEMLADMATSAPRLRTDCVTEILFETYMTIERYMKLGHMEVFRTVSRILSGRSYGPILQLLDPDVRNSFELQMLVLVTLTLTFTEDYPIEYIKLAGERLLKIISDNAEVEGITVLVVKIKKLVKNFEDAWKEVRELGAEREFHEFYEM